MDLTATRLSDRPIIHPGLGCGIGTNVNGPSLIRMPDWAPGLGRYHLYFAHHTGRHIRLAYADRLQGPWTIHEPGVLTVEGSFFIAEDGPASGQGDLAPGDPFRPMPDESGIIAHIASPDMHIDAERRRLLMYYHGVLATGDQRTRLAVSDDGLAFRPLESLLGPPYFRVFAYGGAVYAVAWGGDLLRAPGWEGPFVPGGNLLGGPPEPDLWHGLRHAAVWVSGDRLDLFYSRIGDCPEAILHARVRLDGAWQDWRAAAPRVLLEASLFWEGVDCSLAPSRVGAAGARRRELRDPCVFVDRDERSYLLYAGAGEAGIGIAALHGLGDNRQGR